MGVLRVRLLYQDRDVAREWVPPANERDLTHDLGLDQVLHAMAAGDAYLHEVARATLFTGLQGNVETIRHRQAVMHDCLANPDVARRLYDLAVEGTEARRRSYYGIMGRYPGTILSGNVELLRMLVETLRTLRAEVDAARPRVQSPGLTSLFALLQDELTDDYLATVGQHLEQLRLRHGVFVTAQLGDGNAGTGYVLRQSLVGGHGWLDRLLGRAPVGYSFRIPERDESAARALSELRDRALNDVANAVAQAADHVVAFFDALRAELAFYVGALNLHARLEALGVATSLPQAETPDAGALAFDDLVDVSLALASARPPVGNSLDLGGRRLVVVTGANQGGKSTFLRALGLAHVMMQGGMFVGARRFAGSVAHGVFTHGKREEDTTMTKGKLDEELSRLSDIADAIVPGALLLCNESFGATNEREGSAIARQALAAFVESGVRVVFVTHLYDFARGVRDERRADTQFLRAERAPDGTRTFRLLVGEPLQTSFGADVYRAVFGGAPP